MRPILRKIKPASGFSNFFHLGILVVLPAVIFVLVRLDFVQLALSIIVLSKWRMFAVRPRFWLANVRANAVDLMVGLSIVLFMSHTTNPLIQLSWAALYAIWLVVIKPGTSIFMTSAQALIGQLCGLMALYLIWASGPTYGIVLASGLICFLAASHFLNGFDEPYSRMLSYFWGYFGAALAWLLSHWLLFYSVIAQPTLLLCALGYGLAVLYYLDHIDRLSKGVRRQFIFIMIAIVLVVLLFSDWGNKVV
jgi:hypothetical protein